MRESLIKGQCRYNFLFSAYFYFYLSALLAVHLLLLLIIDILSIWWFLILYFLLCSSIQILDSYFLLPAVYFCFNVPYVLQPLKNWAYLFFLPEFLQEIIHSVMKAETWVSLWHPFLLMPLFIQLFIKFSQLELFYFPPTILSKCLCSTKHDCI